MQGGIERGHGVVGGGGHGWGHGDSLLLVSYAALIQEVAEHLDGPTGASDMVLVTLAGGRALAFEGPCEAHWSVIVLWDLGVMPFEEARDCVVLTVPEAGEEATIHVRVEGGGHTGRPPWAGTSCRPPGTCWGADEAVPA